MGAHLFFKTKSNPNEVATYLLEKSELNKKLIELDEQNIYISCQADIDWAKKERPDLVDMMEKQYGTGDIKTSGQYGSDLFLKAGYNPEVDLPEMWVMIFEELNERFEMKYYARSCSLTTDYFTVEQMKRITNNGLLLSGKSSPKDYVVEKYNELYALLNEPEVESFDISIIKHNDTILVDDKWLKVEQSSFDNSLKVQTGLNQWDKETLEQIAYKISAHKKFIPKIGYYGAVADIESYILDQGTLVYLELAGQEGKVKAITSVLMQGKIEINKQKVYSDTLGFFNINSAGNRRKLVSLEDGMIHTILYHSPSITDTDFSILIGRDKTELITSFSTWLEKSQPLPYPKDLTNKIYEKLQNRDKLISLNTFNIEAVKIDLSILEDEYNDMQEIILEVCRENGLIDSNAKPIKQNAPLPKSTVLSSNQVKEIFDTLNSMPKTYELEDVDIKPIGLKLFSPNMTLYITEADKGCEDDEFLNEHTQCYGYIKNELDPTFSEWGYINVREYLEAGNGMNYFEQDLHFENMYIDSNGSIGKKGELENKIHCPNCGKCRTVEVHETIDDLHHCSCIDCQHIFTKNIK